jgi:hypothetical protein
MRIVHGRSACLAGSFDLSNLLWLWAAAAAAAAAAVGLPSHGVPKQ